MFTSPTSDDPFARHYKQLAALDGRSNNPKNRWSDKAWREAIRVAVLRAHEDPKKGKKLAALADALVDAGLDGDVPALREIGDRLDGKVSQPTEHTGQSGGPITYQLVWGDE